MILNDLNNATVSVNVANSIVAQKNFVFLENFMNNITDYFETQVFVENFNNEKNKTAAINDINRWVADQTKGIIDEMLNDDDLSSNTVLVLMNGIYFNLNWKIPFNQSKYATTKSKDLNMMNVKDMFKYAKFNDGQLIEILFVDDLVSMFVFLPSCDDQYEQNANINKKNFNSNCSYNRSISSLFTAAKLEKRIDHLKPKLVDLYMPKFNLQNSNFHDDPKWKSVFNNDSNRTLSMMGIENAFKPKVADFSLINNGNPNLYLTKVVHKILINISENVVYGAGVTSEIVVADDDNDVNNIDIFDKHEFLDHDHNNRITNQIEIKQPKQEEIAIVFRADHRFMFTIRNRQHNITLFAGIVNIQK